jgi:hypothetical protein
VNLASEVRSEKDNPLPFVDHVHEFSFKIVEVFVGGFMRAPREGALNLKAGPRRGGELDRHAAVLVEAQ